MSGTPLQNNTFDIFAQMNFLNPGLLGNTEFFRNEFATPIDKFGEDQDQKEHLRKLLYPFILRRTKEPWATDLPEKKKPSCFVKWRNNSEPFTICTGTPIAKRLWVASMTGIAKSQPPSYRV